MEAEEIPRAFTKPGPPVMLLEEFDQVSKANNHGSSIGKAPYSSELDANRVTELSKKADFESQFKRICAVTYFTYLPILFYYKYNQLPTCIR